MLFTLTDCLPNAHNCVVIDCHGVNVHHSGGSFPTQQTS